jgi:tetratricopeptide (TPR) repeat protein
MERAADSNPNKRNDLLFSVRNLTAAWKISLFMLLFFSYGAANEYAHNMTLLDSMRAIQHSNPRLALKWGYQILEAEYGKDPAQLTAMTRNTLGELLQNQGLSVQALEHYADALEEYIILKDSIAVGWIYVNMGNVYFHEKHFLEAKQKYHKAMAVFEKINLASGTAVTLNNLALIHLESSEPTAAMDFFLKGLELRKTLNNPPLLAHSYLYVGDVLRQQKKIDDAMAYYQQALETGLAQDTLNLIGITHERMGEVLAEAEDFRAAFAHFRLAEEAFQQNHSQKQLVNLYHKMAAVSESAGESIPSASYRRRALNLARKNEFFQKQIELLTDFLSDSRNYTPEEKIAFYRQLDSLRQILFSKEIEQALYRSELKLENSQYKQSLLAASLALKKAVLVRNVSFAMGGMSLLLLLSLFYRYLDHKRSNARLLRQQEIIHNQEMDVAGLKAEKIRAEMRHNLEMKQRELITKVAFLQQKNDQLKRFRKEIELLTAMLQDNGLKKQFKNLQTEIQNAVQQDEGWDEFQKQFIEIHPGFFENLTRQFPQLHNIDLKMCAFLKMNLNTKEIATLTGLSIRAVENRRYRLRKKLNLTNDQDISQFILELK